MRSENFLGNEGDLLEVAFPNLVQIRCVEENHKGDGHLHPLVVPLTDYFRRRVAVYLHYI